MNRRAFLTFMLGVVTGHYLPWAKMLAPVGATWTMYPPIYVDDAVSWVAGNVTITRVKFVDGTGVFRSDGT